jgi:cyclase
MVGTTAQEPVIRELGRGIYAYLQRGSWGYSNAGLIADGESSLLVDTLYDLALTERMLRELRRATPAAARIDALVNTHANGDHCWGNQLLPEAEILSSRAAAAEMLELSPALMATMVGAARRIAGLPPLLKGALGLLGRLGVPRASALADAAELVAEAFGPFQFRGIKLRTPTQTFSGRHTLQVGDKTVELIEVGPAHTQGDVIVHVPADRVAFTGDILFIGSHPIVWAGPVANWIAACDRLLALDVDTIVPGHGPLTDKAGVQATRDYWSELQAAAHSGRTAGLTPEQLASELVASRYPSWGESERLVVNLDTIYRELDGDTKLRDPLALLARMSRWKYGRAGAERL